MMNSPFAGRMLYRSFKAVGLDDVSVEVVPIAVDDLGVFSEAFVLARVLEAAEDAGVLTDDEVRGFLRRLAQASRPAAERELAELEQFAAGPLEAWDLAYHAERLKQQRFAVSQQALRPYFPLPRVLQGLFSTAERLFGLRIVERDGVPTWHEDVRHFEIMAAGGELLGAFYLDPYARTDKRGGAWMDDCIGPKALGDLLGPFQLGIGHDDHELLAAIATSQINSARVAAKARREFAQHVVAGVVPVCIVDAFEMVDIADEERQRPPVRDSFIHQRLQVAFHVAPVVKSGQRVAQRDLHRLVACAMRRAFGGLQRADVGHRHHQREAFASGRGRHLHGDMAALSKLHRVADQIEQYLPQAPGIALDPRLGAAGDGNAQANALCVKLGLPEVAGFGRKLAQLERLQGNREFARFQPREVQQIGQQALEMLAAVGDRLGEAF